RQREYYQLLAFFNNTEAEAERTNPKVPSSIQFRSVSLALEVDEPDPKLEPLHQEATRLDRAIAAVTKQAVAGQAEWEARTRESLGRAGDAKEKEKGEEEVAVPAAIRVILAIPEKERTAAQRRSIRAFYIDQVPEMARLKSDRAKLETQLAALRPPTTEVMRE